MQRQECEQCVLCVTAFLADVVRAPCDPLLSVLCGGGKAALQMNLILPVLVGVVLITHWNFLVSCISTVHL